MQTTDSSNLFKSDAELLKEELHALKLVRTKTLGEPVQLSSKPLCMEIDGDACWTGESGFVVRKMDLKTGKTLRILKGHAGPVTCIALHDVPATSSAPARKLLISGSWDKSIRVWDRESGLLLSTTISHTDFLKSLLVLPHLPTPLLLSGSSDKQLHIHSLASILFPQPFPTQPTASTPASTSSSSTPSTSTNPSVPPQAAKPQPIPRATERSPLPRSHPPIKTHTRPINCLASGLQTERDVVTVYSADSLGRTIVWEVKVERGEGEVKIKEIGRLKEHKTSVMDLSVGEEGVWTCSADASAMYHPLLPPPTTTSASAKAVSLPTPKRKPPPQIHSLLLLPHLQPPLLLTGSADEHIRVYDLSLGEGPQQARLLREVEGHCAEVVALRRWVRRDVEGREGRGEEWVVSAGLDGTVRRWRVGEIVLPAPVVDEEEEEKKGELEEGMTEEEARELAELMGDED